MGLSLIIPCYNYENSVVANYDKLKKINNIKENVEIIFIDDGSTDNTYKKLKKLQKKK